MSNEIGTPNSPVPINEERGRKYLADNDIPPGIATAMIDNFQKVPYRFFICDDSGSMMANDGQKVIKSGDRYKNLPCTRWDELADSLTFHVGLSKAANAPSEFRLLNQLAPKQVGCEEKDPDNMNARAISHVLEGGPSGGTPLCKHIREITLIIQRWEKVLRENGQKVSLIICTDGMSSDGDVTAALRPLKNLPVLMVIRLCTSEDSIVDYWDKVESDLETDLDIIDDLFGEGEGVNNVNPWINYGMPLQRMREFGVHIKELDMIDERKLTDQQMMKVMSILFNCNVRDVPNSQVDWAVFQEWVVAMNSSTPPTFNPTTSSQTVEPWIQIDKLKQSYGPPGGCCTIA